MSNTKHIVVLSFSDIARAPRIWRQIFMVKDHYYVTAVGTSAPQIEGIEFVLLPKETWRCMERTSHWVRMVLRRFGSAYWSNPTIRQGFRKLKNLNCDLIIAHNLRMLPLAVRLGNNCGAKVLFDAHEYEPGRFQERLKNRFFTNSYSDLLCRHYLPQADAVVTVCQGIADEYNKNYGVSCGVITNAPFYQELRPTPVEQGRIRLIHHGGAMRTRGMEEMIKLMDLVDERFSLDFMLVPYEPKYYAELRRMAETRPRIRFREPVPMPEIPKVLNEYDIGLYPLSRRSFNLYMALPNKFFEFIQARLAVAIWPSPEMARVVNDCECGVVADEFTIKAIAEKLNCLSREQIMYFKENSDKAASIHCAENNQGLFLETVHRLLGART